MPKDLDTGHWEQKVDDNGRRFEWHDGAWKYAGPAPQPDGGRDGSRNDDLTPTQWDARTFGDATPDAHTDVSFFGASEPPPPVPGGSDAPGKGTTRVNTAAMRTFAANLTALSDVMTKAQEDLASIEGKLAPGTFPAAMQLRKEFGGEDGFVRATSAALDSINSGLIGTQEAIEQIALKFDSNEESNKITASELSRYMEDASGAINSLEKGGG
jgi:hypothetical protein